MCTFRLTLNRCFKMRNLAIFNSLSSIFPANGYNSYRRLSSSVDYSKVIFDILGNYKSSKIKRVFVLEKITKFDLEIQNGLTQAQILKRFPLAYNTHLTHKKIMESLLRQLKELKIDLEVVKAQTKGLLPFEGSKNKERMRPDLLISAGGDGTFLEAASLIPPDQLTDRPIWLAGLNTDPERSIGSLCMSYFGPRVEHKFNCGYYDYDRCHPIPENGDELSNNENNANLLNKFEEQCSFNYQISKDKKILFKKENEDEGESESNLEKRDDVQLISHDEYVKTLLSNLINFTLNPIPRQRLRLKLFKRRMENYEYSEGDGTDKLKKGQPMESKEIEKIMMANTTSTFEEKELTSDNDTKEENTYCYPQGVMNDVMIADQEFGKTFYAIIQVDDRPLRRIKSSGLLVTTGTGSTAWSYNISKMNFFNGTSLIKCLLEHPDLPESVSKEITEKTIRETIECYNQKLKMDPSKALMRCIVREPITNKDYEDLNFYNCKEVKVLPLSKNAVVCIEGSKNIRLDYGDVAVLKTFERDLIWSFI